MNDVADRSSTERPIEVDVDGAVRPSVLGVGVGAPIVRVGLAGGNAGASRRRIELITTIEAVGIFVLTAIPGVIAVEILGYGRPPLRRREAGATLALYVLLSGLAWGAAGVFLNAEPRLVSLILLDEDQADQLVNTFVPLACSVLGSAVGVGLCLRFLVALRDHFAEDLYDGLIHSRRKALRWAAGPLATGILADHAWDRLLARAQRQRTPQLVRVRLRDGAVVYGVFAGSGRADYNEDGRGLLLDRELVESAGDLVEVGEGGLFIHPDAVATVSFVDRPGSSPTES